MFSTRKFKEELHNGEMLFDLSFFLILLTTTKNVKNIQQLFQENKGFKMTIHVFIQYNFYYLTNGFFPRLCTEV